MVSQLGGGTEVTCTELKIQERPKGGSISECRRDTESDEPLKRNKPGNEPEKKNPEKNAAETDELDEIVQ